MQYHVLVAQGGFAPPIFWLWARWVNYFSTAQYIGSQGRARTADPLINSQLLYLLSYLGINSIYNDILLFYRQSVSSVIKSKNPNLLSKAFDQQFHIRITKCYCYCVTTQYACENRVSISISIIGLHLREVLNCQRAFRTLFIHYSECFVNHYLSRITKSPK